MVDRGTDRLGIALTIVLAALAALAIWLWPALPP
jgi:hypothetical protein